MKQNGIKRRCNGSIESFHREIAFFLFFGQFFGIMPLRGIFEDHVRFEWKSINFLYAIFHMAAAFISATFCCIKFARFGFLLDKTATLSFYICNFVSLCFFVRLAQQWRPLIGTWTQVEDSLRGEYTRSVTGTIKRFKLITIVVFSLALVEHILFILNAMHLSWKYARNGDSLMDLYFKFAFPHVFCVVEYSHWNAIIVEITNVLTTVCWNFTDAFIILVSTGIALRFRQINIRLEKIGVHNQQFWQEIRQDYNNLTHLCQLIDGNISALVTISFVNNLFFICIQFYNTLKPRYGLIPSIYFFYSFGFLLARTIAVSLYAAWINDESKKPLYSLFSISSNMHCLDIEMLGRQIHFIPVGITGSKFFLISRSFLLKVSGTIITFELMLLQFGPLLHEERNYNRPFYHNNSDMIVCRD